MTDRSGTALGDPPTDMTGFPRWRLRKTQCMWRAHTVGRSPWWFSSDDRGRFNLAPPHGACYLATDVVTALRERFGPELVTMRMVSAAATAETVVSQLFPPKQRQLADATHPDATQFGVTRELFTVVGDRYQLTRRWATALHANGARGIRYQSRFTSTANANAFALFDDAGLHDWPADSNPLPGAEACAQAGLAVLAPPTRRQVRIVDTPQI
ncbi:RES family NAD+ phosphorylase [Mycolicibacterium gadium]|uniref:RES family NAD+ phosphorylase n=1 Tax=Mycolicibacterium gadium TaxID=1794 RepID=A0ABT6GLN9_MYCGU|nr:RES family NAD+ phosphorylase [Mycolicibacterium gadium]MDG5481991.1 RES family NAD+ phosphorylase [Mycolicibacterium gadium]